MSEQRPVRRRRPQMDTPNPAQAKESGNGAAEEQKAHRIIAGAHDEPDWLVSAERVSGAAGRRTGTTRRENANVPQREPQTGGERRMREGRDILTMKKAADGAKTPKAAAAENGEESGSSAVRQAGKAPVRRAESGQGAAVRRAAQVKKAPAARQAKAKAGQKPLKKKLSKKARARRNAQIRRMALGLTAAVLVVALAVFGAIGGSRLLDIKQTLDAGDGVFYPNIFVNGIPLAGMTLDQAAEVVTRQVQAQIASWKITLCAADGSGRTWDITGQDMKMAYDVADQLDQLWAIGHTGSASARYEQVRRLQDQPAARYTTLSYDLSRVNQILSQIKTEVDRMPVSATRVDDNTKWPPYSYTDDVPGQELDITEISREICGMVERLESGRVDLTPTPVKAPVTRAELEGRITLLSEYETAIGATSDPGRFINIEVGTKKFDKLIIKSGESVSFNKVAGKRTYSNGYADAPEVAYGDYTMGVGGGICQVSSTLYNAVVNAGLTVTKRTQHSLPSNYVPYGLDATVADDRLDFVFKNNTNSDIYISTEYYKKKGYWHCKFIIHGRPDPNGYTYKLESEIKEELPIPEPTYIPDKDAQYVVYDDEVYEASKGDEGYVVDVYMVKMDSKGLEVSREYMYTDTYKTKAPKYYVGVTPRETPVPAGYTGMD